MLSYEMPSARGATLEHCSRHYANTVQMRLLEAVPQLIDRMIVYIDIWWPKRPNILYWLYLRGGDKYCCESTRCFCEPNSFLDLAILISMRHSKCMTPRVDGANLIIINITWSWSRLDGKVKWSKIRYRWHLCSSNSPYRIIGMHGK